MNQQRNPSGTALGQLRREAGLSVRALAARINYSPGHLSDVENGRRAATADLAARCDAALGTKGRLTSALLGSARSAQESPGDDLEAVDLARRATASEIGDETLARIEAAVDDVATRYATQHPAALLADGRRLLRFLADLMDARATLRQRRRLLDAAGWLSLLTATLHIDLGQQASARARLATAARLGSETEDAELVAWCLETRAWNALTAGDHAAALSLALQARAAAPVGGSAYIQATAQTGRAYARLGDRQATASALIAVERLTANLAPPDQPEHHFRYDPAKAWAYTATTLAWAGDPAAAETVRTVLAQFLATTPHRPRRVAAARIDLGLALTGTGELDEAAAVTMTALRSGRVVPSNRWRVVEISDRLAHAGLTDLDDLLRHLDHPGA
ncbi:helix-turn-helix domain-containing protein [Catellatospora methionotrophica]|uniref:helix-turn-helix domain-containing protein n=1 Tax=Catellatospora methionotrophica TaxID=121620 RepID=UPI0033EB25E6